MKGVCSVVLPASIKDEIFRSELCARDLEVDFHGGTLSLQGMLLTSLRETKRKKKVA